MKKFILILIVFIGIIIFFQCQKKDVGLIEGNHSDPLLETRSTLEFSKVVSPNCNIYSYIQGLPSSPTFVISVKDTFETDLGCKIEVVMDAYYYPSGNNYFFEFRNLKWRPILPFSSACDEWYRENFGSTYIGDKREYYYDFVDTLRKFVVENYMEEWVIQNQIPCTGHRVSSFFYKSPCTQLCHKTIQTKDGPYFVLLEKPCADDGCCVEITDYCLTPNGVTKFHEYQLVHSCTNYIIVDCEGGNTVGACIEKGCF